MEHVPVGRAQALSLCHWQKPWLGLQSGVSQGLERLRTGMTSGFGCIFLHHIVPTHQLQSSGPCSSLSARAQTDALAFCALDEGVELWNRRARAVAGTGWDLSALESCVGHSCTLLGALSAALCGDWWAGLPSHHCGLCYPGVRRETYRGKLRQQRASLK